MADLSRGALNWSALDASIIEAITEIRAARACIRHDAQTKAVICRNKNCEAPERFVMCFEDAERMLDEIRAQMAIARSILAGAPCMPERAISATSVTAVTRDLGYVAQTQRRASWRADTLKKRLNFVARYSTRKFAKLVFGSAHKDNRIATIDGPKRSEFVKRHLMVSLLQALPFALRRRLWRSVRASFGKTAPCGRVKVRISTYHHAFYPRPAFVLAAMVGLGVVASIAWSAWAPTAVSAANAGPTSAKYLERSAVPARGCSVSGWGKACYPRRSQI